jgi:hypothetical protein
MHVIEGLGLFDGAGILHKQVNQALEIGESMNRFSLETGAATGSLQTLKFAADAAGTSFGGVN